MYNISDNNLLHLSLFVIDYLLKYVDEMRHFSEKEHVSGAERERGGGKSGEREIGRSRSAHMLCSGVYCLATTCEKLEYKTFNYGRHGKRKNFPEEN